ncbi:MAG: DUF3368 domain-containing protein [bacterium]
MSKIAILNNTVLSNFSSVNRLDLIKFAFDEYYTSKDVVDEVSIGIKRGYDFLQQVRENIYPLNKNGWLRIENIRKLSDYKLYDKLLKTVSRGEASCIVIAYQKGWIFVSDDKDARIIADSFGVKISGTLGILKIAIDKGIISIKEADFLLDLMIKRGYRAPIRNIREILEVE